MRVRSIWNCAATLNNLTVNFGSAVDIGAGTLTVSNSVTNYGTLRQTKSVSGNQTCANIAGLPLKRCYTLSPAGTHPSANIKFYYTQAEMQASQTFSGLNIWHYNDVTVKWDPVTRDGDNGDCTAGRLDCYVQGNNISSYSPFVLEHTDPLAVNLVSFTAAPASDHNIISWETASELTNQGFYIWRSLTPDAPTTKLTPFLIPSQSPGGTDGYVYSYNDFDLASGGTSYYWLEDVDLNGTVTRHGPVPVSASGSGDSPSTVTLTSLQGSSSTSALPLMALALALLAGAGVVVVRRRS